MHFGNIAYFVQPIIQHPNTLNKVKNTAADRDVFKVTWFHEMSNQVPES
jgi:hypothetical protein